MAAFSQTILNTLTVFGAESPNVWGSALLGTSNWGYGDYDLVSEYVKVLDQDSFSFTDLTIPQIEFIRTLESTLAIISQMGAEVLTDRAGYELVFGTSSNAQNRPLSSYNRVADVDVTYTTGINTTTTWTVIS